jgi:hypothetical protein
MKNKVFKVEPLTDLAASVMPINLELDLKDTKEEVYNECILMFPYFIESTLVQKLIDESKMHIDINHQGYVNIVWPSLSVALPEKMDHGMSESVAIATISSIVGKYIRTQFKCTEITD